MIIVELIGGLGNQMFQYAAGRGLATKLGTELKLDISGFEHYKLHAYSLHHLSIEAPLATRQETAAIKGGRLRRALSRAAVRHYHEEDASLAFEPGFFELPDNTYLKGYWQSETYFGAVTDRVRREFRPSTPLSAPSRHLLERLRGDDGSVSVHVRRGDYVSNASTGDVHGLLGADYYRTAMDALRASIEGARFYAFSDDPAWVAEAFSDHRDVTVVDINDAARNYEDLTLMSACRHHVVANSSFSWWGAWLGGNPDRQVFAPRRWFADPTRDARDLVPSTWHQL